MVYSTIQPPPPPSPPQTHTVCIMLQCIYSTFSLGRGGGGGQREDRGATVHKYSSFVHGGNSSQAGSKIPTMSECISNLLNLLNTIPQSLLKVVTSEKIGGSGVTSTLGTWYGGVVMGVLLSLHRSFAVWNSRCCELVAPTITTVTHS
jgi:hypothetical protein